MSITDHPSYTHSRRPDVIERRSAAAGAGVGGIRFGRSTVEDPDAPATGSSGTLVVRPWWDPDLAITGHPLGDPYVEMFWLGVLGPSVTCLLRRFDRGFSRFPEGFRLSVRDTARAIGIGTGTGRNGPLNRTIDRVCTFHLARRSAPDQIDVRLHVPSLSARQVSRLPLSLRNAHEAWMSAHRSGTRDHATLAMDRLVTSS